MLSSVAEKVYWLGRYLERIENSARLMDVYSGMIFDMPRDTKISWEILLDITGSHEEFSERFTNTNEATIIRFLIADEKHSGSLISCLKLLRENARTTREILPAETWTEINDTYLKTRKMLESGLGRKVRSELFPELISDCQRLSGLLYSCMSHNTVFFFIQLGRLLERADMTTRIVDVGSITLLPAFAKFRREGLLLEPFENVVWMNVLLSLSGYQAYRQTVHNRVKGVAVVRFLLQDRDFPRSLNYCLSRLGHFLEQLPNNGEVLRAVLRVKRLTQDAVVDSLLEKGLLNFIDELQISIGDIHEVITANWFRPDLVEDMQQSESLFD